MRFLALALALSFCHAGMAADADTGTPPGTIQLRADQLSWKPAPMPAGVEIAVLEGDPRQPGLFTLRLRVPAGTRLAAHTHPQPERVTVISGAVGLGFSAHFDPTQLRVFGVGDYYVNPPLSAHFVGFAEDSVVQITGEDPWRLDHLQP